MKSVLLSLLFFSSLASANQVLHCKGDTGPGPAEAVVEFQLNPGDQNSVEITFKNKNYPQGISGNFSAHYSAPDGQLSWEGMLGPVASTFYLTLYSNGDSELEIYGDRSIDYGFGADLLCR